jgi:hypothetical protein
MRQGGDQAAPRLFLEKRSLILKKLLILKGIPMKTILISILLASSQVMAAGGAHTWKPLYNPIEPAKELSTKPDQPSELKPEWYTSVSDASVTLTWKEVPGVTGYHLQVATDPMFKWLVVNENYLAGAQFTVNVEKGKQYYWRVAGMKKDNEPSYIKSAYARSMFETK